MDSTSTDTTLHAELITVRDHLRYAVSRFGAAGLAYGHGTTTALDDAAFLILETLHLPHDELAPWLDARLLRTERAIVHAAIERRVVTRKPTAYLTQSAYIGPYRFYVDERVIVPRSFIGELMLAADDLPFGLRAPPRHVLDLCAGSGCLAIVAAHIFPEADVTAADISTDALAVAERNISAHRLVGRVAPVKSDLFAALETTRFDLIIANPPYVTAAAVAAFPPEHKSEPALAHLGGADGMDLVRRIIAEASHYLAPSGTLVVEVGQGRAILERDYPELPFLWLDTEHSFGEVFQLPAAALQAKSAGAPARKSPSGKAKRAK